MFARHITWQLKPHLAKEFPVTFEKEIVPLLKKQKGFMDELLLVTPEKKELVAISLWETKEHAEIYHRELYPKVEKMLEKYFEGAPAIKHFEEQYATFHKIAAPAMV
jgi:heme-degrading monooxygenase HmoA